ncbi:MAG: exodeoxyribonuclease III [Aggregatilineales bacterium]
MKFYSWNVNGIRAAKKKGMVDWLTDTQPDILGVQETKARPEQLTKDLLEPEGYHVYWSSSTVKKGYSGVGLYSKVEPKSVQLGLGIEEYDQEGRTIVAEYDDFVFITAYFPNGGRDHARVPFKMAYKDAFLDYCNAWRDKGKGIVFCGDVNTSHHEIDLARPKQNVKNTGFMPEERVWLDKIVEQGYVDTYRHFYPDKEGAYSWWSYRGGARSKNVGWRLDYFFISEDLVPRLEAADIHADVMGSDHCPVSMTMK